MQAVCVRMRRKFVILVNGTYYTDFSVHRVQYLHRHKARHWCFFKPSRPGEQYGISAPACVLREEVAQKPLARPLGGPL